MIVEVTVKAGKNHKTIKKIIKKIPGKYFSLSLEHKFKELSEIDKKRNSIQKNDEDIQAVADKYTSI